MLFINDIADADCWGSPCVVFTWDIHVVECWCNCPCMAFTGGRNEAVRWCSCPCMAFTDDITWAGCWSDDSCTWYVGVVAEVGSSDNYPSVGFAWVVAVSRCWGICGNVGVGFVVCMEWLWFPFSWCLWHNRKYRTYIYQRNLMILSVVFCPYGVQQKIFHKTPLEVLSVR